MLHGRELSAPVKYHNSSWSQVIFEKNYFKGTNHVIMIYVMVCVKKHYYRMF